VEHDNTVVGNCYLKLSLHLWFWVTVRYCVNKGIRKRYHDSSLCL